MDFPSFDKNANRPRQEVEVTGPAFDANAGHTKSDAAAFVDQQWRDVAASSLSKDHPLSLNRDSEFVTDDPYAEG